MIGNEFMTQDEIMDETMEYNRLIDDRRLDQVTDSKMVPTPTAYRYTDASGTHLTDDFNDIQDTPGIEEWTPLLDIERYINE